MKALIIDDEELARAVVREHLAAHPMWKWLRNAATVSRP